MYAPVGQQDGMEQISTPPNWRANYEHDYPKYLDSGVLPSFEDLPRATSAPPHLRDGFANSAELLGQASTLEGMDSYTDVRYDEEYKAFYERFPDKSQLPRPFDDKNTLYNGHMQMFMSPHPYKDPTGFPVTSGFRAGNQFGLGFTNQPSLGRGGLETVVEQPHMRKFSLDEPLNEALQQLQLGAEIQRPGSQPAPNLIQAAIASGAGHFRSASAFPSFDVDNLSGFSSALPPTSSPAPNASHHLMQSAANDRLNPMAQGGNLYNNPLQMAAYQAAYEAARQAAYEAAFLQQTPNPQMVLPNSGLGMGTGNFANPMGNHSLKTDLQGFPKRDASLQTLFASPQSTRSNGEGQGSRFDPFDGSIHDKGRGGRGKRSNRPRDMPFNNDAYYDNQYYKFNSIEEVVGQVIQVAQDQNGCRFLQRKFDEGGAQTIAYVFPEILENVTSLMKDPFGNYLIQKLLDRCSEEQRTEVVKAVAEKGELVTIALSTHGTRAVQKLIETLTSKEQRALAIQALAPGVVHLIKDLNGNHVVQRCLQRLGPEDSQFIYDTAVTYCVEIASHRHGCCVLQRCIDFATHEQRRSLIMEISTHAYELSQDAFGNYVVQYVLDLGQPEASQRIMTVLSGHYAELAVQKFSSNVVEKCLKLGGLDDARESIIREIMESPALPRLLQDQYGNYVIQSALAVTSGSLHQALVKSIQPYLSTLRGTPHGKRILQKVMASLKEPYNP